MSHFFATSGVLNKRLPMKNFKTLAQGTLVQGPAGLIGIVERITKASNGTQVVLLKTADGQSHYRIPLSSFSLPQQVDGQLSSYIEFSQAELARYRLASAKGSTPPAKANLPLHIPLAEETLTATTEVIQRGVVHLHKGVETQNQQIVVPVTTETAEIERIPADQFDSVHYTDPSVIVIPLTEERLVLHKETVITEYIVVRKRAQVTEQTLSDTVRREVLTITPESLANDEGPLVMINGSHETIEHH